MKKLFCFLLAVMLLVTPLVSCGGDANDGTGNADGGAVSGGNDTQNGDQGGEGTDTEVTEIKPDIPEVRYDGEEFRTFVSGTLHYSDFDPEENSGSYKSVNEAIHHRNTAMEEKYGITMSSETSFGTSFGDGPGFMKLSNDYNSGLAEYELCMVGTYDAAQLALGLYIKDLNSTKYIDLEKPYWDQKVNEDLSINGIVFYTTGDISFVDNICTHMIMFNKDMLKELDLTSPYELVDQDKWVFDTFNQYIKAGSLEMDGVDGATNGDRYGLLTWNDVIHQSLFSSRNRICTINDRGYMSLTVYNATTVSVMDKYTTLFYDNFTTYNYSKRVADQKEWDVVRKSMFDNGQALFYTTLFTTVPQHRDSMVNFGIIPYPKFTEDQDDYGHYVSGTHAQMMCIEALHDDESLDMISLITEDLAYTSSQTVTPAYYDTTLIGKNVRDEESVGMLDIIFATRVYDVGVYYKIGGAQTVHANMTALLTTGVNNFASRYEELRPAAQNKIDAINEQFENIIDG